mgnify:CR=1 FL=1
MDIIYNYYKETLNESIVEEVEKCIHELLSYKPVKVFIRRSKFWQV